MPRPTNETDEPIRCDATTVRGSQCRRDATFAVLSGRCAGELLCARHLHDRGANRSRLLDLRSNPDRAPVLRPARAVDAPVYTGPNPPPPAHLLVGALGWRYTKRYPTRGRWEPTGWEIVHPDAVKTYTLNGDILRDSVLWAPAEGTCRATLDTSAQPQPCAHQAGDPRRRLVLFGDDPPWSAAPGGRVLSL